MDKEKPFLLFDSSGKTYVFKDRGAVAPNLVTPVNFDGLAVKLAVAPANLRLRPSRMEPEVSGRHFVNDTEVYHTTWEWGTLCFYGESGFYGTFFCCHAHFGPFDARAYYDPTCDMIPFGGDDEVITI